MLASTFAYRIVTFSDETFQSSSTSLCQRDRSPTTPSDESLGLGYSHFARRYYGNRFFFLFLRVLRCFSSPGCLPIPILFSIGWRDITPAGLPHSEISGSRPTYGSPKLIAADHVLLRLLAPRHPPYALTILTFFINLIYACFSVCNTKVSPPKRTNFGYLFFALLIFIVQFSKN